MSAGHYTISVDLDVKAKLTEYCERHGKKVGKTAETAINQYLRNESIKEAMQEASI